MPTYCYVHEPREASKSLFGVPNNLEIKILWEEALRMQLKKSHRVCVKHFYDSDIISTRNSGQGSSKYTRLMARATTVAYYKYYLLVHST
ncbi:52 kDa repressor of the inhibitor of the protein kinase-like [Aphis craccivora]|uniref:52 kDa repressor of the inhibitor of the protein kinase-like n=1 Tax=Aphis craccivora TaxID=307492 RepID=A0A6G0Y3I3_APHCR|nr:52 kDa repressor of the inhibitor of the protein kinase-like [Aphis craccivora]